MIKEIKTSNAEKCDGPSRGAGALVEKGKGQRRPSRLGGPVFGARERNLEIVLLERPGVWLVRFGANYAHLLKGTSSPVRK